MYKRDLNLLSRTTSTYKLFRVKYFEQSVEFIDRIKTCHSSVRECPSIDDVINLIVNKENENRYFFINRSNVFIEHVDQVTSTYSNYLQYAHHQTNEFFRTKNILSAFSIDEDESNLYVVVEEFKCRT